MPVPVAMHRPITMPRQTLSAMHMHVVGALMMPFSIAMVTAMHLAMHMHVPAGLHMPGASSVPVATGVPIAVTVSSHDHHTGDMQEARQPGARQRHTPNRVY